MKLTKNMLCVLLGLALISPQYTSGANKSNPGLPTNELILLGGVTSIAALGFIGGAVGKMKRKFPIKSTIIKASGLGVFGFTLITTYAYIALLFEFKEEYEKTSSRLHNLNLDLFTKLGKIEFKGIEKREFELEGKTLEERYSYVNEICSFGEPVLGLDTPRTNFNVERQGEARKVVRQYITMGCGVESLVANTAYEVKVLMRYDAISEEASDAAYARLNKPKDLKEDEHLLAIIPPRNSEIKVVWIIKVRIPADEDVSPSLIELSPLQF